MKKLTKAEVACLLLTAVIAAAVVTGCKPPGPERRDVSGEITYVQESTGWSYPIHTVIQCDDGFTVRVSGAHGVRGDKVKIKNASIIK